MLSMIDWIIELLIKRFKNKHAEGRLLYYREKYKNYVKKKEWLTERDNIQQASHPTNIDGMSK